MVVLLLKIGLICWDSSLTCLRKHNAVGQHTELLMVGLFEVHKGTLYYTCPTLVFTNCFNPLIISLQVNWVSWMACPFVFPYCSYHRAENILGILLQLIHLRTTSGLSTGFLSTNFHRLVLLMQLQTMWNCSCSHSRREERLLNTSWYHLVCFSFVLFSKPLAAAANGGEQTLAS